MGEHSERRGTRFRDSNLRQFGSTVVLYIWTANKINKTKCIIYKYMTEDFIPHSTEQNVGFEEHERESIEESRGKTDPLATLPLARDASLGEFLSRPVRIWESSWTPSTNMNFTLYPWALFFINPRVENRVSNFKLLRCNLCVKIVLNGNSFYYGRLMINYNPMADRDQYLELPNGNFERLIRLSQRQHLMCDPCTSTAGCLGLPFLYDKEFFDVTQLATDTQEIGSLSVSTPVGLKLATETLSTAPVTLSIFAWATDVVVGGLTNTNLAGLTPQASPVGKDETGMKLSDIAHSVSVFAGRFGSFPVIGTYAKATELATKAVGNIAQIFGFSRPTLVEEPMRYEPRPVSSLATCTGQDNSVKLTTDPKQEVSIDPLIWSDPSMDQLSITDIATTWTILDKFTWTSADDPSDLLFNSLVDPGIYHSEALNSNVYPTAVCSMVLPFKYWSGSMKFKFDVVASAYHRGRLAIVYDPHETPAVFEANTNYMEIIDISDNRKTEFTISNTQDVSLRKRFRPKISDTHFPGAGSGYSATTRITNTMISNAGDIGNGTISVFVVNELTSPNSTIPVVEVLVSVCAGDDFRVYDPVDDLRLYGHMVPQASPVEPLPSDFSEVQSFSFGVRGGQNDCADVYIGEKVLSIRSMMKRYVAYITMTSDIPEHVSTNLTRFKHAMYPLQYLKAPDTVHTAALSSINYVGHTYLSYYRAGFAVLRGGVRWKMTPLQAPPLSGMAQATVTRLHDTTYTPMADVVMLSGENLLPRSGVVANQHSPVGEAVTINDVNGSLEFETPYHANRKFVIGSSSEETKDAVVLPGFQVTGSDYSLGDYIQLYCAASEDLTLGHFIGFPAITYYPTIPAAL